MKEYFLNLFAYDHYANEIILNAVEQDLQNKQTIKLMAHLLSAQQIWLNRCMFNPNFTYSLWPNWNIEEQIFINNQNYAAWTDFLNSKHDTDLSSVINYQNSTGKIYNDALTEILTHLINHGTHHRAQIGQLLKYNGFTALPNTDYITYLRTHKK